MKLLPLLSQYKVSPWRSLRRYYCHYKVSPAMKYSLCKTLRGRCENATYAWQIQMFYFLLLARYVPNVEKRSIWDQCKKKYILTTDRRPTNDRPTSHLAHIGEISNGHISARGRPIHFMFGSTVGFSGSADRMALFPVSPNPRWRRSRRRSRHLEKFKWRYLRCVSSDLLRV